MLIRPALPTLTSGNVFYADIEGYKTWFSSTNIPVSIANSIHVVSNSSSDELTLEEECQIARECGMPLVGIVLATPAGEMNGFAWSGEGYQGRDAIFVLLTYGSLSDLIMQLDQRNLLDEEEWGGKIYGVQGSALHSNIVRAARPLLPHERREPSFDILRAIYDVTLHRSMM